MTLHSSPFCFIYDAKFSSMLNLVTVNFCPWRNHSGSGITCPSEDKGYTLSYSRSTTLCVKSLIVILDSVINPLEVITEWGVFTCKWCKIFNFISISENLKFIGFWQCSFSRWLPWGFWIIKKWWLTVKTWLDSWYWI